MDDSNKEILIKSLELISQFYVNVDLISNGREFVKIHERNILNLKEIKLAAGRSLEKNINCK